jgi:hypothetical protein
VVPTPVKKITNITGSKYHNKYKVASGSFLVSKKKLLKAAAVEQEPPRNWKNNFF